MIVPMKKVHFIFHSSRWEENIEELQHIGVVDINVSSLEQESAESKEYQVVKQAYDFLNASKLYQVPQNQITDSDMQFHGFSPLEVSKEIVGYSQERANICKHNLELKALLTEVKVFGEVSSNILKSFTHHNVSIKLYKAEKKTKSFLSANNPNDDNLIVKCVAINNLHSFWIVIAYNNAEYQIPLSWNEYHLPELTPKEIQKEIEINNKQIYELEMLIAKHLPYINTLSVRKIELENTLLCQSVLGSGKIIDNSLLIVDGFVPQNKIPLIKEYAEEKAWGLTIDNPAEDDDVPTLLKTFPLVQIIKPLFKLMDTIPGYKEFDISAWFLLFISLFFSMIIGDAGYGLIIFVFTLISLLKSIGRGKASLTHALMLWFSTTTIVWGVLTGNFFGNPAIAQNIPFINTLIINDIAISNPNSNFSIMLFCFRIGIVHLLLAHAWKMLSVVKESIFAVFLQIATGSFLFCLYFITLFLILGAENFPLPSFVIPLLGVSCGVILITCEQQKGRNFFIGILKGLSNLFNIFLGWVGSLADLISYIRLFAVGLASLAIAQAFNTMGGAVMSISVSSPVYSILLYIAGGLVIAFGHTLNLAMGLLAVMVHGVRLNLLEFGMHLGMEWTGRNYTPFQRKIISLEEK